MQTTGHNIANVNTEGFSRQRAKQVANDPIGSGNLIYGTGSSIRKIERIHNEYVEKRILNSTSEHHFNQTKNEVLNDIEAIFNEINNEGLNQIINKFFNAFRELSTQPESETTRSLVRENAKILVRDIRRMKESINEAVSSLDRIYEKSVNEINNLLNNISNLNVKISTIEANNGETGDLRDERDLNIRTLSEYFALDTYSDNQGHYVVNARGIGTLVTGSSVNELKIGSNPNETIFPGSKDIYLGSFSGEPISGKFQQGSLASVYETKNQELKMMQEKLDLLAWHLTNSVNAIHKRGYTNDTIPTDDQGNPLPGSKNTQINFFKPVAEKFKAAEKIDLSDDIKGDLRNIVSALNANSPGDNRIAIAISKLQHESFVAEGTKTLEEDYLEGVGIIGMATSKSKVNSEQSESILTQMKSMKERISGVSIDEEASNLMRQQQAYEASARVIKVAEEMFKTVLSIKN